MSTEKKRMGQPVGRGANYPKTFRFREEDERRLKLLKDTWGCSEAAVIRRLLLEAVKQEGLSAAQTQDKTATKDAGHRPIWEVIDEIMKQVPAEDLADLPTDLAEQHDHYIYGTPKR
jgi:hypothetical protein